MPKLGAWREQLDELLATNEAKPRRERLTAVRIFETLRDLGFDGGNDAVRRYAKSWRKARGAAAAQARSRHWLRLRGPSRRGRRALMKPIAASSLATTVVRVRSNATLFAWRRFSIAGLELRIGAIRRLALANHHHALALIVAVPSQAQILAVSLMVLRPDMTAEIGPVDLERGIRFFHTLE